MKASKDGVASINDTSVVRGTVDAGVDTSNKGVAWIDGTNVVIVTVGGIEWGKTATCERIARLVGAHVAIITDGKIMVTLIQVRITIIVGAQISIIAILGGCLAKSVATIADVGEAIYMRANNHLRGEAMVARKGGIHASSLGNNTRRGIARAVRNTLDGWELATQGRIARSSVANIWWSASDRWEITSRSRQTEILSAEVSVIANQRCVGAGRTIHTNSAAVDSASISIITRGWANASSLARTETMASWSTRRPWESDTSGRHQRVNNTLKSAERGNRRESSASAWCNWGNLSSVSKRSNTHGEDDNAGILYASQHSRELGNIDVINTVRKHNEDSRNTSSSVHIQLINGQLKPATDASGTTKLDDSIHWIDERLLNEGHVNGETSRTRELNKSHSYGIGPEDEIGSQSSSKLNFSYEISWLDGARFVKDENDIHESVALLRRTIPAWDNGKRGGVKGQQTEKVYNHARSINGSARESAGGRPNGSNGVSATHSKFTAGLSIDSFLIAGGNKAIAMIGRNGSCPSLSIASTAEKISQFLVKIEILVHNAIGHSIVVADKHSYGIVIDGPVHRANDQRVIIFHKGGSELGGRLWKYRCQNGRDKDDQALHLQ
jgi:hypothetical protein